jgi:hypothetical protein
MPRPESLLNSRVRQALFVYGYTVLGIFLLVAPWTPVWDQAARGLLPEPMQPWALSGWLRGGVSALGVLDLGVALQLGIDLSGRG